MSGEGFIVAQLIVIKAIYVNRKMTGRQIYQFLKLDENEEGYMMLAELLTAMFDIDAIIPSSYEPTEIMKVIITLNPKLRDSITKHPKHLDNVIRSYLLNLNKELN